MSQNFQPGDFLLFQIESGFGLLKILAIDTDDEGNNVWHLSAFEEMYLDPEMADMALQNPSSLSSRNRHIVLTQRAFEATQVARMLSTTLTEEEIATVVDWRNDPNREISDRSARLLLGLR